MVSSGKNATQMKRLLVISLLFTMVSFAQQVTVSTDTTTYLIGDYIRVQLQADALVPPSPSAGRSDGP